MNSVTYMRPNQFVDTVLRKEQPVPKDLGSMGVLLCVEEVMEFKVA